MLQTEVRGEKIIVGLVLLGAAIGACAGAWGIKGAVAALAGFLLLAGVVKYVALVYGYNAQRAKLAATEHYGELVAREQAERLAAGWPPQFSDEHLEQLDEEERRDARD